MVLACSCPVEGREYGLWPEVITMQGLGIREDKLTASNNHGLTSSGDSTLDCSSSYSLRSRF